MFLVSSFGSTCNSSFTLKQIPVTAPDQILIFVNKRLDLSTKFHYIKWHGVVPSLKVFQVSAGGDSFWKSSVWMLISWSFLRLSQELITGAPDGSTWLLSLSQNKLNVIHRLSISSCCCTHFQLPVCFLGSRNRLRKTTTFLSEKPPGTWQIRPKCYFCLIKEQTPWDLSLLCSVQCNTSTVS